MVAYGALEARCNDLGVEFMIRAWRLGKPNLEVGWRHRHLHCVSVFYFRVLLEKMKAENATQISTLSTLPMCLFLVCRILPGR
jgi:hypothetical protein